MSNGFGVGPFAGIPDFLIEQFQQGYAPCDEPPGMEEQWYKQWKETGGIVCEHGSKRTVGFTGFGNICEVCNYCGAKLVGGKLRLHAE